MRQSCVIAIDTISIFHVVYIYFMAIVEHQIYFMHMEEGLDCVTGMRVKATVNQRE